VNHAAGARSRLGLLARRHHPHPPWPARPSMPPAPTVARPAGRRLGLLVHGPRRSRGPQHANAARACRH